MVKLKVACKECEDGEKGRVAISKLMDDLRGMKIVQDSAEFTYKRRG